MIADRAIRNVARIFSLKREGAIRGRDARLEGLTRVTVMGKKRNRKKHPEEIIGFYLTLKYRLDFNFIREGKRLGRGRRFGTLVS